MLWIQLTISCFLFVELINYLGFHLFFSLIQLRIFYFRLYHPQVEYFIDPHFQKNHQHSFYFLCYFLQKNDIHYHINQLLFQPKFLQFIFFQLLFFVLQEVLQEFQNYQCLIFLQQSLDISIVLYILITTSTIIWITNFCNIFNQSVILTHIHAEIKNEVTIFRVGDYSS